MNIIITAKMGNGTIQGKLEPLILLPLIENIYFLRKTKGPGLAKVNYILLPGICRYAYFNILMTPFLLIYYTFKTRSSFIIGYHIIPYAFFAAVASFVTRKPFFIGQTGLRIQKISENRVFWFFLKKVIDFSEKICVPGNHSYNYWLSKGIPPAKLLKLHSTINTNKFIPSPLKNKLYDFVYVGRISSEKRPEFLIKAFSLLARNRPEAKLLIVGDGPLLFQTIKMVQSTNLAETIDFVGFQSDVLPWLYKSRFIVLVSESEGLPVAVMEAMSAGLIPLTTDVGNIRDIILNGVTGFYIAKNDLLRFAQKMIYLMEMNEIEEKIMQNNARKIIVENHSHDNSSRLWEKILTSINTIVS